MAQLAKAVYSIEIVNPLGQQTVSTRQILPVRFVPLTEKR